jgi:hypothetical protein
VDSAKLLLMTKDVLDISFVTDSGGTSNNSITAKFPTVTVFKKVSGKGFVEANLS